jgi:hypothetical protein
VLIPQRILSERANILSFQAIWSDDLESGVRAKVGGRRLNHTLRPVPIAPRNSERLGALPHVAQPLGSR